MTTNSGFKEIATAILVVVIMKTEFHVLLLWLFYFEHWLRLLLPSSICPFPMNTGQSHMISLDFYWQLKDSIENKWQLESQINESPNNRITQRDAAKEPPPLPHYYYSKRKKNIQLQYSSLQSHKRLEHGCRLNVRVVWLRIPWPDDAMTIRAKGSIEIENCLIWIAMASYPGIW